MIFFNYRGTQAVRQSSEWLRTSRDWKVSWNLVSGLGVMQDQRKTRYTIELRIRRWKRQLQQGKLLSNLELDSGGNGRALSFHGCSNDKSNMNVSSGNERINKSKIFNASSHLPDIAFNMMKQISSLHAVYKVLSMSGKQILNFSSLHFIAYLSLSSHVSSSHESGKKHK